MKAEISLITRFMNRLSFIEKALPTWLKIPYDEIIIVDWNSKEDILPLVNSLDDPRIKIIRVPDQKYFNAGAAWNTGIKAARNKFINTVDCDILTDPRMLENIDFDKTDCFYTSIDHIGGIKGTSFYPKYMWEKINGYVEVFKSWGYEDTYFYKKLSEAGYTRIKYFNLDKITHIDHSDKIRQINFEDKLDNFKCTCKNKKCRCLMMHSIEKNVRIVNRG